MKKSWTVGVLAVLILSMPLALAKQEFDQRAATGNEQEVRNRVAGMHVWDEDDKDENETDWEEDRGFAWGKNGLAGKHVNNVHKLWQLKPNMTAEQIQAFVEKKLGFGSVNVIAQTENGTAVFLVDAGNVVETPRYTLERILKARIDAETGSVLSLNMAMNAQAKAELQTA